MPLITLPTTGILRTEWTQPPAAEWLVASGWSAKQQVIDRGDVVEGWKLRLTIGLRSVADGLPWRAWQALIRRRVNWSDFPAFDLAQQSGSGTFSIASVTDANTVVLSGLPASQTGWLKAGHRATIYTAAGPDNPRLVTLTADINTNGSGGATMSFEPGIAGLVASRQVELRRPICRMRISDPKQLSSSTGREITVESFGALDFEEIL